MSQPNTRETWRLDTIIRIISNFWLEPFACEHIKTLEVWVAFLEFLYQTEFYENNTALLI